MSKTISIVNLGGGNVASFTQEFLKSISKASNTILVEFPCLGLPKMSYALNEIHIEKTKTMDQLILDVDRAQQERIETYIHSVDGLDMILIYPKALPESPTIRKISTNKTLIELPFQIKQQLQGRYDNIIYVLQGMMTHPMTHFALRCSEAIILHNQQSLEFVSNYRNYNKLNDIFNVSKERMFLYSEEGNLGFKEAKIHVRPSELWKDIHSLQPLLLECSPNINENKLHDESIGIIDPLDFLDYRFQESDTEMSQDEQESFSKLTEYIRGMLQARHLDEYVKSIFDEESRQKIKYFIADYVREQSEFTFKKPLHGVIEAVQKEITGLGVLQEVLDEPSITSIEINAPDQIIVEENGVIRHLEEVKFQNVEHYHQTINKILQPIGKPISSNEPIVDANYRGTRVCVIADNQVYQGVSANFPLVSLRKFPPSVYSHAQCIQYGNLSEEIVQFLALIVPCGSNIIIGGGTNSGKTTQLIRLPLFMDRLTRIISIEDSEEMMLASKKEYQDYVNLPSLLVKKMDDPEKSYEIDKLIKASLRLNPTVTVIGEVRDEPAAKQLLHGMNLGAIGWSSIHCNSAREAATRMLQLNGNTLAGASQIKDSIDIIIFQKRLKNGVRVVTEISELLGYKGVEEPILNPIFKYNYRTKQHERVGFIQSTSMLNKIEEKEVPESIIQKWCQKQDRKELCI